MSKNLIINVLRSTEISNLNRDDAGAPKSAVIGGVTRARWSSQSVKREIRKALHDINANKYNGLRTRDIENTIKESLLSFDCPKEKILVFADLIAKAFGTKGESKAETAKDETAVPNTEKTEEKETKDSIGYFSKNELSVIAKALKDLEWDESKVASKRGLSVEIKKAIKEAQKENGAFMDAVDIAIFGRMFASNPELCVEGALCVSHSYSTHESTTDVDFFTAMDDLVTDMGSAHMGTKEFQSSVMAQTFALNIDILRSNLVTATEEEIKSIIKDLSLSIVKFGTPTGNRTGMLSNVFPQFAYATISQGVASAVSFETPVKFEEEGGYLGNSISAMEKEIKRINTFQEKIFAEMPLVDANGLKVDSFDMVVQNV